LWGTTTVRIAGVTLAAIVLGAQGASAATPLVGGPTQTIIVEGTAGSAATVSAAVERLGGTVDARLNVINGVRATIPIANVARLAAARGVLGVSPDGTLVPLGEQWGDDTSSETAKASLLTGTWKADHDLGSAFNIERSTGAQNVWALNDPNNTSQKLTGRGVGVALIDTGISPVEGLLLPGKVVNGPDLSFESQSTNTRYLDGYGHGTHLAGLIAGRDTGLTAANLTNSSYFVGMAPDATIVNVKVGAGDGGVDVSQVIAGIDWVVTNGVANNIRVINLSYGTESAQAASLDPLAHAVESAWRAGIVVVVAAGNDGESGPSPLTMPAIDPFVIAVGSVDHEGTGNAGDLRVGAWTSTGTVTRRPDLTAPGKSVVSLRAPGSFADTGHPEGRLSTETSGRLFRGTGTSQSAAVVSGAVALMVQRNPALTPDQVKGVLMTTAVKLQSDSSVVQGAGQFNVQRAVQLLAKGSIPAYTQTATRSTGLGTLDASRGTSFVQDPDTGATLRGEQDPFGVAWDAATWAPAATAGTAWTGGTWRGSVWAGAGWSGSSWAPTAWSSRSWSGVDWSSRSWSTMTFLSRSWSGSDWTSRSWSADNWDSRSWSMAYDW
jgi:serine protease AprX